MHKTKTYVLIKKTELLNFNWVLKCFHESKGIREGRRYCFCGINMSFTSTLGLSHDSILSFYWKLATAPFKPTGYWEKLHISEKRQRQNRER